MTLTAPFASAEAEQFVALEARFEKLQGIYDRLSGGEKISLSLAMEAEAAIADAHVVDAYFAPSLKRNQIAMEAISGGMWAVIAAGVAALIAVIMKLLGGKGSGGSGGVSSITVEAVTKKVEAAKDIHDQAADYAVLGHESTQRAIRQAIVSDSTSELDKVLEEEGGEHKKEKLLNKVKRLVDKLGGKLSEHRPALSLVYDHSYPDAMGNMISFLIDRHHQTKIEHEILTLEGKITAIKSGINSMQSQTGEAIGHIANVMLDKLPSTVSMTALQKNTAEFKPLTEMFIQARTVAGKQKPHEQQLGPKAMIAAWTRAVNLPNIVAYAQMAADTRKSLERSRSTLKDMDRDLDALRQMEIPQAEAGAAMRQAVANLQIDIKNLGYWVMDLMHMDRAFVAYIKDTQTAATFIADMLDCLISMGIRTQYNETGLPRDDFKDAIDQEGKLRRYAKDEQ